MKFFDGASSNNRVKGQRNIPKGAPVFTTGKVSGNRSEVRTVDGKKGWVRTKYLKKG